MNNFLNIAHHSTRSDVMKRLIENKSFRLFVKSAVITAICLILFFIGFFAAAYFTGDFG